MNDALVMQIDKTFQNLRYVHGDQIFWKLSKFLANVVQGAILAEPASSAVNGNINEGK